MSVPDLLGRTSGELPETADSRAATTESAAIEIPYVSGAVGSVEAKIFSSTDDEDRGGYVIRIRINDQGSSLIPTVVNLSDGIDLHLPGEAEGLAALRALAGIIASIHRI